MLDPEKFDFMRRLPKENADTFRLLSRDKSLLPEAEISANRRFDSLLSDLGKDPFASLEIKALEEVRSRGWESVLPETEQAARRALSRPPGGGIGPAGGVLGPPPGAL